MQREGGESYLSYEVSISCYTFDSTTLYCTVQLRVYLRLRVRVLYNVVRRYVVLPEVLPEVLSYFRTSGSTVHVLYVRKIDCTKVRKYLRTFVRVQLYTYESTESTKVLRKYESTRSPTCTRVQVRKYFRTFVLSYFRTKVLSYESMTNKTWVDFDI